VKLDGGVGKVDVSISVGVDAVFVEGMDEIL